MELKLKESHSFYDRLNKRAIIHYRFNGELVLKLVFNFSEGEQDHIDGTIRDYMPLSATEEKEFLREKRATAWERLLKVPKY